ncbi:hypothetical protein Taro_035633 [Colocasia esculenta]|uniref:Uncharacterized protein n=1 Tax=Colocasia esculenta TaxID=4460 RepID=A0A843VV08_COLES|nr:hypothetical protein [Colocasia esculenta]
MMGKTTLSKQEEGHLWHYGATGNLSAVEPNSRVYSAELGTASWSEEELSPCSPPHGCVFCNVWATPGCGIPAICLPTDVATTERVPTSEEASPRSDATLSRPGWPSR